MNSRRRRRSRRARCRYSTDGLNRRPRPAHPPAAGAPPSRTICVCTPKPPSCCEGWIFDLSLLVGTCTLVQYKIEHECYTRSKVSASKPDTGKSDAYRHEIGARTDPIELKVRGRITTSHSLPVRYSVV